MGLVAGILVTILFSPPSPETVRAAVDAVYADGRVQKEIGPSKGEEGPERGRRPRHPWPSDDGSHDGGGSWSAPQGLGKILLVGLALVVVVGLGFGIAQAVLNRRRPGAVLPAPGGASPSAPRFEAPLGEAEALAAAGRFVEAIHLLLLKTFATLVEATATVLPPALTSREILDRVPLKPEARDALDGLVSAVEAGLFGGRPADRPAYDACVDRVRRFAAAYGRTAA